MRKGQVKTLVLVLFILLGLAFVFSRNIDTTPQKVAVEPNKQAVAEDLAKKHEDKMKKEKMDPYLEKIKEMKKVLIKSASSKPEEYKKEIKESFGSLSMLIEKLPGKPETLSEEAKQKIAEIKTKSEKITKSANEEELVTNIKEAFNFSVEALEEVSKNIEDKEITEKDKEKFSTYTKERLEKIQNRIDSINVVNYKQRTNQTFEEFAATLKKIHKHIAQKDRMQKDYMKNDDKMKKNKKQKVQGNNNESKARVNLLEAQGEVRASEVAADKE